MNDGMTSELASVASSPATTMKYREDLCLSIGRPKALARATGRHTDANDGPFAAAQHTAGAAATVRRDQCPRRQELGCLPQ